MKKQSQVALAGKMPISEDTSIGAKYNQQERRKALAKISQAKQHKQTEVELVNDSWGWGNAYYLAVYFCQQAEFDGIRFLVVFDRKQFDGWDSNVSIYRLVAYWGDHPARAKLPRISCPARRRERLLWGIAATVCTLCIGLALFYSWASHRY